MHVAVVLGCVATVLAAAFIQHTFVIGRSFEPRFFVVPTLVGLVFGAVLVGIRRVVVMNRGFARELTERGARIERLNSELEERIAERTAELEAKHAQLMQSQRLEVIGQLVAGVAHDFNNLLTVIEFSAHELRGNSANPVVDDILKASERAQRLTRQLVTTARRGTSESELPLHLIVDDLVSLLSRSFGSRYVVSVSHDGASPHIDAVRVEQILLNLLVNARDAQPGGGRISVTTNTAEDGSVTIEVEDDGPGVPDAIRDQVFQPYFSTKTEAGGSGLGLATVRSLVGELGGEIRLKPDGDGACFVVVLPGNGSA